LIVEYQDRLCRFGSNYIELLLSRLGIRLEIVNMTDNSRDELMTDLARKAEGRRQKAEGIYPFPLSPKGTPPSPECLKEAISTP